MEGTGENMFCSNCGCELQDGWSVCPNCGMRIEEEGRTSQMNVGTNQYDPNSVQMQGQPLRSQPPQKPFGWFIGMEEMVVDRCGDCCINSDCRICGL